MHTSRWELVVVVCCLPCLVLGPAGAGAVACLARTVLLIFLSDVGSLSLHLGPSVFMQGSFNPHFPHDLARGRTVYCKRGLRPTVHLCCAMTYSQGVVYNGHFSSGLVLACVVCAPVLHLAHMLADLMHTRLLSPL